MKPKSPRTQAIHDSIIEFAKNNPTRTAHAIAEDFGYDPKYVTSILHAAGVVPPKKTRGKLSDNTLQIIAAWIAGGSYSDVAEQFGCTKQYVGQCVKRARDAGLVDAIRKCDQSRVK